MQQFGESNSNGYLGSHWRPPGPIRRSLYIREFRCGVAHESEIPNWHPREPIGALANVRLPALSQRLVVRCSASHIQGDVLAGAGIARLSELIATRFLPERLAW